MDALGRSTESLLSLTLTLLKSAQDWEKWKERMAMAACDVVETYHRSQALWLDLQGNSTTGDAPWLVMPPRRLGERHPSGEGERTREES